MSDYLGNSEVLCSIGLGEIALFLLKRFKNHVQKGIDGDGVSFSSKALESGAQNFPQSFDLDNLINISHWALAK